MMIEPVIEHQEIQRPSGRSKTVVTTIATDRPR